MGSFDDDASYILTARALLAGHGLTGHETGGAVVVGLYPPGYGALLAPLAWLWPHTFVPMRLLSVACYALVFVLTWVYLGRRGVGEGVRSAVLVILALGPAFATFGSMVMAETPFLVVLLLMLLFVDTWDRQDKTWTWTGLGVVLSAASVIWIKEAGIGVVVGLIVWLALKRDRPGRAVRRTLAVAAGVTALLLPVVVARLVAGVPLAGARYSQELGAAYTGSLADRVIHVVPHSLATLLSTAIPATLVPYLSPLPIARGFDTDFWRVLSWQVTLLAGVGAVVWYRRHRDAAVAIVPVYLAETLFWPYVNERRAILVLPLLAAWYVVGAVAVWQAIKSRISSHRKLVRARTTAALAVLLVVVVPLIPQMPRDYLLALGQNSSHFDGSRYASILAAIGPPSSVVETDYLSSTALFTGHETAWTAFTVTENGCYQPAVLSALAADRAGFLLVGDLNKPGVIDRQCLLQEASSAPWAVRLLHTSRDDATVFELIGPGTGHPELADAVGSVAPRTTRTATTTTLEWDWGAPRPIDQVTIGEAAADGAPTTSVTVELRQPDGGWEVVARAGAPVGDGAAAPYLLASLARPVTAGALRLVVTTATPAALVNVADVHALGPAPAS